MVLPSNILSGTKMCEDCAAQFSESEMATVLKQVLKQEFGAILEYDAGYRGVNGGISRYDIFISQFKTLIECQSEWHDLIDKAENDINKRIYAVTNGYNFIEIDNRDYTPLQAIQIFIPEMVNIPSYVDNKDNSRRSFSLEKAQKLLDSGYNYGGVASILGVRAATLRNTVNRGKLKLPDNYKNRRIQDNIVIQIDVKGNIVGKYEVLSIQDINIRSTIIQACTSRTHIYSNYYWYYESDYVARIRNT